MIQLTNSIKRFFRTRLACRLHLRVRVTNMFFCVFIDFFSADTRCAFTTEQNIILSTAHAR